MIKIHTACKNCIFAEYEGKTQMDCRLGKIEKFEENNNDIIEVFDEEKEFYVIDGRKCQFFRTNDWMKNNIDVCDAPNTIEDLLNKEVQIGVDILLLVKEGQTFDDIKTSLLSIEKSTIKPESVIIVLQNVYHPRYPIDREWIKSNITIPYSVEYVVPKTTIEKCINLASKRSSKYYLCVLAGQDLIDNFLEETNKSINERMWPILYIEGVDYHQMFVNKGLHDFVGGFGKRTLHNKVLDLQKELKCKNTFLIYKPI